MVGQGDFAFQYGGMGTDWSARPGSALERMINGDGAGPDCLPIVYRCTRTVPSSLTLQL